MDATFSLISSFLPLSPSFSLLFLVATLTCSLTSSSMDGIWAHLLRLTSCLCVSHLLLCYCLPIFYSITKWLFSLNFVAIKEMCLLFHSSLSPSLPLFLLHPCFTSNYEYRRRGALLLLHHASVHHLLPISCRSSLFSHVPSTSSNQSLSLVPLLSSVKWVRRDDTAHQAAHQAAQCEGMWVKGWTLLTPSNRINSLLYLYLVKGELFTIISTRQLVRVFLFFFLSPNETSRQVQRRVRQTHGNCNHLSRTE